MYAARVVLRALPLIVGHLLVRDCESRVVLRDDAGS